MCSVAWGVTASPTAITVYMSEWGAYGTPSGVNLPPLDTAITISGSGNWNLSRGGDLSTTCSNAYGYCFTIASASSGMNSACVDSLPAGSGATTLYLCWKNLVTNQLTVGSHTGTAVIGSTSVSITLVVLPRLAFNAWVWPASGLPSGCSAGSGYDTENNCTITNQRPPSTSFSVPSVGSSYVDPQFGSTIRRLSSSGQFLQYSAMTAFNADETLVSASDTSGNVNLFSVASGSAVYTSVPVNGESNYAWSPTDANIIWFYQGATIKYRNIGTSTTTTAADYSSPSGGRPAFTTLFMGGTSDITDDGWWTFYDSASGYICAVNLNGLTALTQESQTFCADYGAVGVTSIDFPLITQVDSESGKRYVIALADPAPQVWSVGESSLSYEYEIPTGSVGFQASTPHSDSGQDEYGRQFLFLYQSSAWQNTWLSRFYLNKKTDLILPMAVGGGFNAQSQTAYGADGHFGCTWTGTCVVETAYVSPRTAQAVSTLTTGSPCQINQVGHGYANGSTVQISGALGSGSSVINGIFTITTAGANAYTIPVDCTGATYTSNSASSANGSALTSQSFDNEIQVIRPGGETRRMAFGRFVGYEGNSITSYRTSYAFPSISRSGRYVAFNSNMGVVEQPSVYVADVGFPTSTGISSSVAPADTEAVINYILPAGQGAATITVSASPSLTFPVVSVSNATSQYVATGLTAETLYYYRVQTVGFSYTGQFVTLPALSGSGRLQVSKGGGGTVQYGTTTGLGSSCTSPCDITVARGVIYTDVSGAVVVQ